jgi:tRNA U34 5-carboxymethylaminomethyl modifying GTPase MnmE/TrmE
MKYKFYGISLTALIIVTQLSPALVGLGRSAALLITRNPIMSQQQPTIVAIALAIAHQQGSVGIVRLSGATALTRALVSLENVQGAIDEDLPWDFWTIDLRDALQALGEITGEDLVESVLDNIFSR